MATHSVTVNEASSETCGMMENCTIRNIDIMKTDIRDCTLYYVEIHTSDITNSMLYNCKVFNSSIKTSELFDTRVQDCNFEKSKLSGCNITNSPLAFRRFPCEIRNMIFELSLALEDGKSPALLVALRADKILYPQAISLFYKTNFFVLNRSTMSSCSKLSRKAISNISKLSIDGRDERLRNSRHPQLPECIVQHANVKELHVIGYFGTAYKWMKAGIKELGNLKKLIVEIEELWTGIDMEALDKQFGISSIHLEVNTAGRRQWVWEISEDEDRSLEWFRE